MKKESPVVFTHVLLLSLLKKVSSQQSVFSSLSQVGMKAETDTKKFIMLCHLVSCLPDKFWAKAGKTLSSHSPLPVCVGI